MTDQDEGYCKCGHNYAHHRPTAHRCVGVRRGVGGRGLTGCPCQEYRPKYRTLGKVLGWS